MKPGDLVCHRRDNTELGILIEDAGEEVTPSLRYRVMWAGDEYLMRLNAAWDILKVGHDKSAKNE